MTTKYFGSILTLVILTSCAHSTVCPAPPPAPEGPVAIAVTTEPPGELVVEQKMNQKLTPTGPSVFVRAEIDPVVFGADHVAQLIDTLKTSLKKKNFDVRAVSNRAQSEMTVTSFEDPARNLRGVMITWGLRRPNRRPTRWFQQTFAVRAPIAAVWDKFSAKIFENFDALEIAAPAPAVVAKISADPGCAPRFGFDSDQHAVVTAVVANSPAARAGVRVGDVIEAVDSRPPSFDRPDVTDDVYYNRVVVPLRLNRQGALIRTTIRAENVCE